jgi:hypothetical protein
MIDAIQTGADYLHSNFTGIGLWNRRSRAGIHLSPG